MLNNVSIQSHADVLVIFSPITHENKCTTIRSPSVLHLRLHLARHEPSVVALEKCSLGVRSRWRECPQSVPPSPQSGAQFSRSGDSCPAMETCSSHLPACCSWTWAAGKGVGWLQGVQSGVFAVGSHRRPPNLLAESTPTLRTCTDRTTLIHPHRGLRGGYSSREEGAWQERALDLGGRQLRPQTWHCHSVM